jgi:hypothetical protein
MSTLTTGAAAIADPLRRAALARRAAAYGATARQDPHDGQRRAERTAAGPGAIAGARGERPAGAAGALPGAARVQVGEAARALARAESRADRIDGDRAAAAAREARVQIQTNEGLGVLAQAGQLPHELVDLLW